MARLPNGSPVKRLDYPRLINSMAPDCFYRGHKLIKKNTTVSHIISILHIKQTNKFMNTENNLRNAPVQHKLHEMSNQFGDEIDIVNSILNEIHERLYCIGHYEDLESAENHCLGSAKSSSCQDHTPAVQDNSSYYAEMRMRLSALRQVKIKAESIRKHIAQYI